MKSSATITSLLSLVAVAQAAYSGDIVQYWNNQLVLGLRNATPRLSSVHEGWLTAYVHSAIFAAAESARGLSRNVQQVAVSHAAYASLSQSLIGQQGTFNNLLKAALADIGANARDTERGERIGKDSFTKIARERNGDGAQFYVNYDYQPAGPGVYQRAPPANAPFPSAPNGAFIKPFGGVSTTETWKAPPDPTKLGYDVYVKQILNKGGKPETTPNRTAEETEIGYYWLESSAQWWNRFATEIVRDRNANNVYEAAKFYALLNWGIANAGFVGWKTKYTYNSWRPITAIRFPSVYLSTGENISNPDWEPLTDTPSHPDYLSGHAVYGGGAGGILKKYFRTDAINPPVSLVSNVSIAGPLTRTFNSVDQAIKENGDSRVFIGVHFQFASDEGNKAGIAAANKVWDAFHRGGRH